MASMKLTISITGQISVSESATTSGNNGVTANPSVPASQQGTLTTRTNNTAGTLTMGSGSHGITTGQRVDLYWATGRCYGVTVGTVSGTSVPIASVAGGDNLPAASTVIYVGISTSTPFNAIGNNVQQIAMGGAVAGSAGGGYFVFNNGSTDVFAIYLPAGSVYSWKTTDTDKTNPLAGVTPTKVYMSHSVTTGAVTTMSAGALVN